MSVTVDDYAKALGRMRRERSPLRFGNVVSVGSDGMLNVRLNASDVLTPCEPYCDASAGSRVIVLKVGGVSCAIARRR